jgi:hypothetical protein
MSDEDGVEHLVGIADASSSLALLSTLVMAIALDKLLEWSEGMGASMLLLSFAASFSVYTITFSVLEYYYVKILLGARSRVKDKHGSGRMLDLEEEVTTHGLLDEDFVEVLTSKFASLNHLRKAARDSMWMSLISIFSAMTTLRSNGLGGYLSAMTSSHGALCILAWLTTIAILGYYVFRDWFFQRMVIILLALAAPLIADTLVIHSNYETIEVYIDIIIFQNILFAVPYTVYRFRTTFVEFLRQHAEVV